MNTQLIVDEEAIKELIDTLELYLNLIKEDLPQLTQEHQRITTTLLQLKTQNSKVDNIGKLLKETNETFNTLKKELAQTPVHLKKAETLEQQYQTLKNKLIIAYALLGFIAGFAVNHFLPF